MEKNRERLKWWGIAVLWTGLIYSTLGIIRSVFEFLKEIIAFRIFFHTGMVYLALVLIIYFFSKVRIKKPLTISLFTALMVGYFWLYFSLNIFAEKIHLVEYGFLAYFIYRALSVDMKGWSLYLCAIILCSLIGWGDEGIQYILPDRFFEWRDVRLNALSSFLGLCLVLISRMDKIGGIYDKK